jgi:SAM-dependent methyltransferase
LRSAEVGLLSIRAIVQKLGYQISVLDLGCGTGKPIAIELAPLVQEYFGIDESAAMIKAFCQNVNGATAHQMPMEALRLESGQFDLVFAWGSLCHLLPEKQKQALASAAMILKPGGILAFTSGESTQGATGRVGVIEVTHYSLGADGYDNQLAELGLSPVSRGYAEGGFYLYVYKRDNSLP